MLIKTEISPAKIKNPIGLFKKLGAGVKDLMNNRKTSRKECLCLLILRENKIDRLKKKKKITALAKLSTSAVEIGRK